MAWLVPGQLIRQARVRLTPVRQWNDDEFDVLADGEMQMVAAPNPQRAYLMCSAFLGRYSACFRLVLDIIF
jgi:hypothetical protein